jgi:hypothetical protein
VINIPIPNEQLINLVHQLPEKEKDELFEDLLIEKWINSPEGKTLMAEREDHISKGNILTHEQMLHKLGFTE